jgi:Carboxypeptidase regulatory-like domain
VTIKHLSDKEPAMRLAAIVVWALFLVPTVFSQGGSGSITGTAADANRAPTGGVSIQAKNETGSVFKTVTNQKGEYTLPQLPAGKYELTATTFGFKPFERKDISLQAGQTLRVDIPLGDFISLDTLGEDRANIGRLIATRRPPPSGPAPRTADGKPDLSGVWYGALPAGPAGEEPDLLPWAQAAVKERYEHNLKDSPQSRCLPFNIQPVNNFFFLTRIVQTRDLLVSILEYDIPGYREIHLDGRGHPKDLEPSWTGHSVGKWEGDTLVIETVGYNDKTWLGEANPHTDNLKVITRLKRPDLGHLEMEITFDDPGTLKKPWVMTAVAPLAPADEQIHEFICNENNQDLEHLVGK